MVFEKKIRKSSPCYFRILLQNWHDNLQRSVRWNVIVGVSLYGVRQQGIDQSPYLLTLYGDDVISSNILDMEFMLATYLLAVCS